MTMKTAVLTVAIPLLAGCAAAPAPQAASGHGCFHRNEAVEKEIGYCQALRSGNRLYISGIPGQGEMSAAARSAYDRLKLVLEANGLGFTDVVKENVYATDLDAFIKVKDLRKDYYGEAVPAATWVQVQRLYAPALVVEIELVAEYPPGK
jgi:enamine deaminase RidA (YjgF/YER057c/UK114 family)